MSETYKTICFKCAGKVHKEIKQISLNDKLVMNIISYICNRCKYINLYKDMFVTKEKSINENIHEDHLGYF